MNPHYSVSQMNMFWRCGLQYMHRYVNGLKVPPGVAVLVGKGGHKSVEANLKRKKEAGLPLDREAVEEIAYAEVKRLWAEQPPLLTEDEQTKGEQTVRSNALDRAVCLSGLHYAVVAPEIMPTHVEREWRLHTPLDVDLVGIIDVCEPAGIRDTKFVSRTPSADDVHGNLGLTAYHMARCILDGSTDWTVQIDAMVSTKQPKYVAMPTTRTAFDHQRLLNRIAGMHTAIQKGVFLPCPEGSWMCTPWRCGYWNSTCPYGRRGRERMTA